MQQLEPVRFNLEKRLATRESFRRVTRRFQRQTRFGVVLDFFEQILHGSKDVASGSRRELKFDFTFACFVLFAWNFCFLQVRQ